MTKTLFAISVLFFGALMTLASCAKEVERPSTPTATAVQVTPTATPSPTLLPTATAISQLTPAPAITPPATAFPEPTSTPVVASEISGGLFLRISNLPKESVVRTNAISINGTTSPDALVSVNGVFVDVEGDGQFTANISLQPEPNLIEVIASDFQGNSVSAVLTIIYIP